jgi:hypothetical protein
MAAHPQRVFAVDRVDEVVLPEGPTVSQRAGREDHARLDRVIRQREPVPFALVGGGNVAELLGTYGTDGDPRGQRRVEGRQRTGDEPRGERGVLIQRHDPGRRVGGARGGDAHVERVRDATVLPQHHHLHPERPQRLVHRAWRGRGRAVIDGDDVVHLLQQPGDPVHDSLGRPEQGQDGGDAGHG